MERLKRIIHLPRSSVPKASPLTKNDDLPSQKMVNVESNFTNPIESGDPLCMQNDAHSIQEALATIEKPYYLPTFDSGKYEIGTTAGFSCRELGKMKLRLLSLDRQNRAVSRRVSELVLEKHPRYENELKGVLSLQADNLAALATCREVRSVLKKSREALVYLRLTILRNFRRRKRLQHVLGILRQIYILRVNARQLDTMLSFGDYHAAIRLHRESLVVLEEYHQYRCTEWIHFKLKAFGSRIDDILDKELKDSCTNFSEPAYTTLQRAFELLGSTQTTVTQLQMHYVCAVHSRSLDALLEYVVADDSAAQQSEPRSETVKLDGHINSIKNYKQLCSTVPLQQLSNCLTTVCQSMGKVLVCYHRTMTWHKARARGEDRVDVSATGTVLVPADKLYNERPGGYRRTGASYQKCTSPGKLSPVGCDAPDGTTSGGSALTREEEEHEQDSDQSQLVRQWHDYVAGKLMAGRLRIWSEVVERVEPLLKAIGNGAVDMGFDEVARILSRFVSIGEEFSAKPSSDLLGVLRSSIYKFFRSFHRTHMERLRMFIEHETWDFCPVRSVFTIFDLQEFRDVALLFTQSSSSLTPATLGSPSLVRFNSIFVPPYDVDQFFTLHHLCNDKEVISGNLETNDDVASNDLHSPVTENVQGFPLLHTDGQQKITSQHFPTLSNTSLEVLRLMGRYIQIMVLLQPIVDEVMHCICQVFDYYLYSVFTFFGPTQINSMELPDRLRQTLKRIRDRLISTDNHPPNATEDRFPVPQQRPMHVLNCSNEVTSDGRSKDLWCSHLQAMLVGVESVVWLAETLDRLLLPNLSNCLPERKRSLVLVFREQSLLSAELLREPCAASLMPKLFQWLLPRATASAVPHPISAAQGAASSIASGLSRIWPLSTGGGGGGASNAEKEVSGGVGGGAAGQPGSGTTSSSSPLVASGLGTAADEASPNPLLSYISVITWKSKAGVDVPMGPSSYVQKLNICVFIPFSNRLQLLGKSLRLPDSLKVILWTALLTHIANCLLDAFGEVRSCSEEGRSQMLLDIRSMATLAESISEIRPFPRMDQLTEYVHAFYQPAHCWDQWLTSHAGQYTRNQLTGLADCIGRGDKRQTLRLRAAVKSHLASLAASLPNPPSSTSSGANHLTSPSVSSSASTTSAATVRE